ncbi:hypothetical protein VRB21_09680 [Pseudomonas poae]
MKSADKQVSDREIDALELLVPAQARKATLSAYFRALSVSQRGVLCMDEGSLVRVSQDGSKTLVAQGSLVARSRLERSLPCVELKSKR